MKQDRFLTGILIGIAILVVLALVLYFARSGTQTYRMGDSPDAVVYNYVLAVTDKDYEKAYSYLAELPDKPSYDDFRRSFLTGMVGASNVGVDVGSAEIAGDQATVQLSLIYPPGDPFSSNYTNADRALLVGQNGQWKITRMPYNFWDYNWYITPVPPMKPPQTSP